MTRSAGECRSRLPRVGQRLRRTISMTVGVSSKRSIRMENVLARYTQSRRIDEPLSEVRSGTTSYYDADGLQSITSLSNPAGALASTYTFDSFGKLTASTGTLTNPCQYSGREFDQETGIYFYRARYYDQNVGRFISEDPLRYPD